ncbi:MAG: hypothetical protein P1U58_17230 [Verrucomicrobiales bacterium]|nr:hypothetical protein [Verrucomicrobiales bacterium]
MSRKHWRLVAIKVFAIVVVAILLIMNFPTKLPIPVANEAPAALTLPVVPQGIDWGDQNEESLKEWENQLSELLEPGSNAVKFSAVVADGETLVSEVIEKSPGVFHLTTLTPTLTFSENTGEKTITIKSERLAMTLGGDLDKMSAPSIIVTPNSIGSVSVFSDESLYRMSVSARPVEGGIEINGSVIEEDR